MLKEVRCAIYTRKSNEDGLEQKFNNPSYGLADKERHRNRGLFRLHGVGNQNRKNMN